MGYPKTSTRVSSAIFRCSYFNSLFSVCLDIPMKHCLECLIYCLTVSDISTFQVVTSPFQTTNWMQLFQFTKVFITFSEQSQTLQNNLRKGGSLKVFVIFLRYLFFSSSKPCNNNWKAKRKVVLEMEITIGNKCLFTKRDDLRIFWYTYEGSI